MNKKNKRLYNIQQDLQNNPFTEIADLAKKYDVSEMTIRRDLKEIENETTTPQTDVPEPSFMEYNFRKQSLTYPDAKRRIAEYAVSLLEPNDSIILDTGTTCHQIAELLPKDIPLTAIVYNSNTLPLLLERPNIKIIFCGGYYHHASQSFESEENLQLLKRLRASKVFVSTSGIEQIGLTCFDQYEVQTKQAAINSGFKKILVTDSSKFGVVKASYFSNINTMDLIITDTNLSEEWQTYLTEQGVEFKLV